VRDLGLETLLAAMADGDAFVQEVCGRVLLNGPENDLATIRYRQDILRDCLAEPGMARELYGLAVRAMEAEKAHWFLGGRDPRPDWVLYRSTELLGTFSGFLKQLRRLAEVHAPTCRSEGWRALFATLQQELDDAYLATVAEQLAQLKFPGGVLLSAGLGQGNKGTGYVLHALASRSERRLVPAWAARYLPPRGDGFRFSVDRQDERGAQALRELRERGTATVARVLGQSTDHVRSFFSMLRAELAFYVGALNLHARLAGKGEPTCFPTPAPPSERRLSFRGIYDPCLSVATRQRLVGNDLDADGKELLVITGANGGGKSTLLRSIGVAQLMMQCGLFVAAESFTASTCDALFTHYRREEDAAMERGKLAEELCRMSDIVDHVTADSLILFNESFAATNEREGSEIARQIVCPLLEKGVRMVFVTHLYDFARSLYAQRAKNMLFLRAEREAEGARTFKLREGEPLTTSFAADVYERVFGAANDGAGRPT
jgi:hypothetical protein